MQDNAAGTQTAEPLVIPTACLFSFVVREHALSMENIANLRNINKKQGINTKKLFFVENNAF